MASYRELPSVDRRVDAIWTYEGANDASFGRELIIPADGSIDVIIERSNDRASHLMVFPATSTFSRVVISPGTTLLGVRFRPGRAGPLVGSDRARRALEALDHSSLNEANIVAALQDPLDAIGDAPSLIESFVEEAKERRGDASVGRLVRLLGRHERALQRAAIEWIGLRPKVLLRIIRAQEAAKEIRAETPLVDAAATLGYADQAHMTREFRSVLGVLPSSFRPVGNLQDGPAESP